MSARLFDLKAISFPHQRFWLHVCGWLAFFATPFILPVPVFKQLPAYLFYYLVITKIIFNLVLIVIFYLNLLVLAPGLLRTKLSGRYFTWLAVLLTGVILLDYGFICGIRDDLWGFFSREQLSDPVLRNVWSRDLFNPFHIVANLILFSLVILASSLLAVLSDRSEQKAFSQQIQLEKTNTELLMLRQQISPHFFFNTLNNIRWLIRQKSERAEDSIMELSDILRYMLYQTSHDKVELAGEITYLVRYINLQKLRLHPEAKVEFCFQTDFNSIAIAPLLFLPFVENAFKYGIDHEQPSLISIILTRSGTDLLFSCTNQIFHPAAVSGSESKGIGLQNVRRRLEMYYPDAYELSISAPGDYYAVELTINNLIHE
ncbi:sensor histidine kinase [Dyadobacter sp. CY356]|uniref:sensor histidine kinase n=1 Tax=Dyadobacter sp. CY356 TaxID=2906442 RepID=UPI001F329816|nr:histidine kinase [Dyadobacter sp. CY356]MCF0059103.1 histidine kinase [Dyadobacter sp. CY356]